MKGFLQWLRERKQQEAHVESRLLLFEHERYTRIPGTTNSFREDPGNTSTLTLKHSHVYAALKGRGRELYAVNVDGTGHDGSSGTRIPAPHADFFRSRDYNIGTDNILEEINFANINPEQYSLIVIEG